jgi:uncharacterized protein (DUF2384 family)
MASSALEIHNVLGLFDDKGQVDLQKTCEFLEVSRKQLAESFGLKEGAIRPDRMSASAKERLNDLAETMEKVAILMKGDKDKTRLWFKVPNPNLGGNSPRSLIILKRTAILTDFINAAMNGF